MSGYGDTGIQSRSPPAKAGVQESGHMAFWVYVVTNKKNGTLYVGMTDDLVKRIWQHRNELIEGFTKQYGLKMLVWFEFHESRESAFKRERQIKKWNRVWKLELIEKQNPGWRDLWEEINA
jgi:putative endonuclease